MEIICFGVGLSAHLAAATAAQAGQYVDVRIGEIVAIRNSHMHGL